MNYEEIEEFMDGLEDFVKEFCFYIKDEANTSYHDKFYSEEKVIAGMQSLQGMFNLKIGMEINKHRIELREKRAKQPSEFPPFVP